MMKSIAFNDTANPADEEGFVIVDTPHGFDSVLEDDSDEESYDHCDDAFSFSSLHAKLACRRVKMTRLCTTLSQQRSRFMFSFHLLHLPR